MDDRGIVLQEPRERIMPADEARVINSVFFGGALRS
jgi:hypothetical protein